MRIIKVSDVERFAARIVPKQPQNNKSIVESIIRDVRKNGDAAIRKYERRFSNANISILRLSANEIKDAYSQVSRKELGALRFAKARLYKTESTVMSLLKDKTISHDGTRITKRFVPIQSVGCYIPGGLARYPSSVIMSVVPAKIAGVKRILVVSPPNSDGKIDPLTVVAANICGADEIYKTGGAQSIAALSYGTNSIPKVDKIVGPGGAFVTTAKSQVSITTGIDMLAGPTELGIIADSSADPKYIALDLISQAEHSSDTFCYLITTSARLATSVQKTVSELVQTVKRGKIAKYGLENNGFIGICKTCSDMARLVNILAPEHLQIMTSNPKSIANKVSSAGLVLIGNNTPSSASDYLLGSNHILPTGGAAKTRGSLSVLDFVKINTQITSSKRALARISEHLQILADAEGLSNHYEAVRGRLG